MLDYLLHIDRHIAELIGQYGTLMYGILFATVFAETGLVIMPFLPGDTLLFAAGLFCRPDKAGHLSFPLMFAVFMAAALCGDNVNYWIGRRLGPRLFRNESSRLLKRSHLDKTHEFFDRFGKRTVILARFVPIVRTFSPFVAGMAKMRYREFLMYSVIGALLWVGIFLTAGYFLGQVPAVEKNFTLAMLAMAVLTFLPMAFEFMKHRRRGTI